MKESKKKLVKLIEKLDEQPNPQRYFFQAGRHRWEKLDTLTPLLRKQERQRQESAPELIRGYIYLVVDLEGNFRYVGQTTSALSARMRQHAVWDLCYSQNPFDCYYSRNTNQNRVYVIERPFYDEINEREAFWIEELETVEDYFGLNSRQGGMNRYENASYHTWAEAFEMREAYLEDLNTVEEISRRFGVCISHVQWLLNVTETQMRTPSESLLLRRERGLVAIPERTNIVSRATKEELRILPAMYDMGYSCADWAALSFMRHRGTWIRDLLIELGTDMRTPRETLDIKERRGLSLRTLEDHYHEVRERGTD